MSWQIGHPIQRDGTNRPQRLADALRPERNPIDAREKEDLLLFLYQLASQFAYYNERNEIDEDNWQVFFDELKEKKPPGSQQEAKVTLDSIRRFLARAEQRQDNSTFMSILLAFLQMFGHLQQDLNTLTQKHLDYYYEKVLGFRRLPPHPDEAHIIFELAPHINQHHLPAGTALNAGKDTLGNPLTYITKREVVLNQARLTDTKTVLLTPDGRIFAAEIANSRDGLGAPLEGELPKWPLFGHPAHMQPATVGFAIASPLLLLKEGQRKITVSLYYDRFPEGLKPEDFNRFLAYGSSEDQWTRLDLKATSPEDNKKITLTITAPVGAPAIVNYNAEKLDGALPTHFPVLRLVLDPNQPKYQAFKNLTFSNIELKAEVEISKAQPESGVRELILQNDQGLLATDGTFQPFGSSPAVNALFYIGSPEVFGKPLDHLDIMIRWADLPENFENHYENYKISTIPQFDTDTPFTATFQVLNNGQWLTIYNQKKDLFSLEPVSRDDLEEMNTGSARGTLPEDRADKKILSSEHLIALSDSTLNNLSFLPNQFKLNQYENKVNQGFIRLSLDKDFGHRIYPRIFGEEAKNGGNFPNPPYTPTIQSLSVGYSTTVQSITPGRKEPNAQFFHLHPFGSEEVNILSPLPCLPHLDRATLFLGFEKLEPPQNLYLLFQLAEGSAISTEILSEEDIQWTYLTDKGWRDTPLGGSEIFIDTTLGLQKSGIMAFNLGRDAARHSSLMPSGRHWLRARISKDPAGATEAIAIRPNAATVVFLDQNNDPDHLKTPLAANQITRLVNRDNAVKKIEQPYTSTGGIPIESDAQFYSRVSERLRHKQRAVTFWDTERLVLQQFPSLYEVKTIPHTGIGPGGYSEFMPGHITVAVIPQLRNQNAVNPLQPRVSIPFLEEIRRYLLPLGSHFVSHPENALHVINPLYEPVELSFSVGFKTGFDAGYYTEVLNDALRRRLSPWAFEAGKDIRFGGKIYKSQLLAFVEEQEYVDFVTDFKMTHYKRDPGIGDMTVEIDLVVRYNAGRRDTDIAEATTAASILVSADNHKIRSIRPEDHKCDESDMCEDGIECWYLEVDFIVS